MFLTSWDRAASGEDAAGISGDAALRWLVDGKRGRPQGGRIAIAEVAAGGGARIEVSAVEDAALFVLAGDGWIRTRGSQEHFDTDELLFIPGGGTADFGALRPLRLLAIFSIRPARTASGGSSPHVIRTNELAAEPFHRPDLGFHHVAARWLVNADTVNSGALIVGQSAFGIGGAHMHHRHAYAEEFFMVLEGAGNHLVEGKEIPMNPGDLVFTGRSEWHGFRNTGSGPVRAIFGYFGANRLDEAGYEVETRLERKLD